MNRFMYKFFQRIILLRINVSGYYAGAYTVKVTRGETYLLRLVNSCLNFELFFAVANHSLNVVQLDSAYVAPFTADTVLIAPGQTLDALLTANQSSGRYYMAASVYSVASTEIVSLKSARRQSCLMSLLTCRKCT